MARRPQWVASGVGHEKADIRPSRGEQPFRPYAMGREWMADGRWEADIRARADIANVSSGWIGDPEAANHLFHAYVAGESAETASLAASGYSS